MDFSLCPAQGPPRLIRFGVLEDGLLATLDVDNNLLRVDQALYDTLSKIEQEMVIRTQARALTLETIRKAA